jgi:thiol:disulfide interchange protein
MTAPAHTEETTASPLDQHAAPVADQRTAGGRRNGRAVAAFVISLIAVPATLLGLLPGLILGVVGIVLGAIALSEIRRRGMRGAGFAIAAIVLGALPYVMTALVFIASAAGGGR